MNRRLGLFLVVILIILLAAFEVKAEQEKIKIKGVAPLTSKGAPLEIRRQEMFVVAFFDGIRQIAESIAKKKGEITVIQKDNIINTNTHEKIGDFEVDSKTEVKIVDEKTGDGELISDQIDINYRGQKFVIQNYKLISPPVELVKFMRWDNPPNTISGIEIEDVKWLSDGICEVWLSFPYETGKAKISEPPKEPILRIETDKTKKTEPPKEPILRIETGMHIAMIWSIGIDAENRYLVTGAQDKTVRVWELSTGRLIKVIRPPIGDGSEGRIDAVAISPDGRTIACGGSTGGNWDGTISIYLFEREKSDLIRRITGLSDVVTNLSYSKDGMYLVATLRNNNGIRIYRTRDYSLIAEDRDYGDISKGADFDTNGRLVTASLDRYVRLYDKNFKLIAKKKMAPGKKPIGVSFSPDGLKIAVGFYDFTKVDVLSAKDLSYLYSPDTNDVDNGSLSSVSWSLDGRYLYAGGRYQKKDISPIRKWKNEGRSRYDDLPASNSTIVHILPLKTGGIVFGSADPAFGIFDSNNEKVVYKSPFIANYLGVLEKFLISNDGSTVQFGYEAFGKSPVRFSVSERLLTLERLEHLERLSPPVTSASGLNITNWEVSYNPKLNGKDLKLEQYESPRSLAISPDNQTFLLGTEWFLRLFDINGNEKWNIRAPGIAWGVNISGNGRFAVAAFGDGTIRWYRMGDGKEILSFFPHKDKKRWVIWTPSGYYDSSPGSDGIIGWHLNNGKDSAADFFPASKFRTKYYRPDVIAKLLQTGDEGEAIRIANEESGRKTQDASIKQMLPPVVSIVSPSDNTGLTAADVILRYSIRTPSGEPVTGVKALIDGRPVQQERGVQIKAKAETLKQVQGDRMEEIREMKITIPERDCEISILAENKYSVSEPATIRIRWKGAVQKDEFVIKPKLYLLSIGVSKYENKELTLGLAAKDAKDFADAMIKQKDGIYRDVAAKVLTDGKATKDEILDGLDWIQKETTSKDVAMVFLAGHGVNDQSGIYYYLPANADIEKLKRTGVAFSDIKNTVASLSGKTLFFVDTCHSGNVMGKRRGIVDITAVVNELSGAENGAVVFASSSGNQYSLEDTAWGNGAFTKALVEGINGKADYTGKGKISINMLDLYLSERVKELTKGKQTPTTTKPQTIADFPIAVRR